ncbi:hypothetical protein Tco_1197592, partial [Tanacetum coccineum]
MDKGSPVGQCHWKSFTTWYYFDAFLTKVEPKNYKEAMKESTWMDAMQEEIHGFDGLQL